MDMQIRISQDDGTPIYQQVVSQVKLLVSSGRLEEGEQLPAVRKLAEQLLINPNTVARAYRELESAGVKPVKKEAPEKEAPEKEPTGPKPTGPKGYSGPFDKDTDLSKVFAEELEIIEEIYETENYLLDPHGAVAFAAIEELKNKLGNKKMICLATAHPAKFPEVIKAALQVTEMPQEGNHESIEKAKTQCEKVYLCDHSHLEEALLTVMKADWDLKHSN